MYTLLCVRLFSSSVHTIATSLMYVAIPELGVDEVSGLGVVGGSVLGPVVLVSPVVGPENIPSL